MNVEIVWLAYDAERVKAAWQEMSVRDLYRCILRDSFRKRVDPRSMLFHKNQFYLLNDLEILMKRGGTDLTMEEYLARLFHRGIEDFPLDTDELFFDYRIISYFTSLRMADEYHRVEPFFATLLRKLGKIGEKEPFSLLNMQELDKFFDVLREVTMQDIMSIAQQYAEAEGNGGLESYTRLVTNYIEFAHYSRNNRLTIFHYNNHTDVAKWGNLLERKQERDRRVVELNYRPKARQRRNREMTDSRLAIDDDVVSKMQFKRRIENLEAGLKDVDPLIRQKAAEELAISGNYTSVNVLIDALDEEEPEVRQEIVRALGEIRDPRSVDALLNIILRDEAVNVVICAAQAIAQIGDPRGLEALVEVLLRGVYDVAVQIAFFPGLNKQKTAIHMLFQAMAHPNEVVRRQVAFVLGEIPAKASVDALVAALEDDDVEVRTIAASSLGRIGSRRALPTLYECRNSFDEAVNRWVVEEAIDNILDKSKSAAAAEA